jgi:hypothetical protein
MTQHVSKLQSFLMLKLVVHNRDYSTLKDPNPYSIVQAKNYQISSCVS